MKDLGMAKKILGMDIVRDKSKDYIQKTLRKFKIENLRSTSTPLAVSLQVAEKTEG